MSYKVFPGRRCRISETPSPVQERQDGGGSRPAQKQQGERGSFIASHIILGTGFQRVKARAANRPPLAFRDAHWLPASLIERVRVNDRGSLWKSPVGDRSNLFAKLRAPTMNGTYDFICPFSLHGQGGSRSSEPRLERAQHSGRGLSGFCAGVDSRCPGTV